jgi:hypothetical protein
MSTESTAYDDLSDEPSVMDIITSYGSPDSGENFVMGGNSSSAAQNSSAWSDVGVRSATSGSAPVVTDSGQSSVLDALRSIAQDTSRLALDWFNAMGGGGAGVQSVAGTTTPTKGAVPSPKGTPGAQATLEKYLPWALGLLIGYLLLSGPAVRSRR